MIVESAVGDHVEDNLTPVGRAYYGFSTLLCTPRVPVPGRAAALGTGNARGRGGHDALPARISAVAPAISQPSASSPAALRKTHHAGLSGWATSAASTVITGTTRT